MSDKNGTADFSRSAIKQVVMKKAITHPATLLPLAAGLGGIVATVLFGSPIILAASAAAVAASGTSFFVNAFLRGKKAADKYLAEQQNRIEAKKVRDLAMIRQELENYLEVPNTQNHADRACNQFRQLEKTLANVHKLLKKTMGNYEVAQWRIQFATEELFLKIAANLRAIVGIFISIESIDTELIEKEMQRIESIKNPSPSDKAIREALIERKLLYSMQLDKVEKILARNEKAITQMEELTTSMATIDAGNEDEIDRAVLQLREVAIMAASLGADAPDVEVNWKLKNPNKTE